jgi:hypothetical protein
MFSSLEPFKVVVDEHGDPALLKKELRNYRATIVVREETITELKEKVDKVTDRFREACRQQKNFEHLHVDAISAGISVGKKAMRILSVIWKWIRKSRFLFISITHLTPTFKIFVFLLPNNIL